MNDENEVLQNEENNSQSETPDSIVYQNEISLLEEDNNEHDNIRYTVHLYTDNEIDYFNNFALSVNERLESIDNRLQTVSNNAGVTADTSLLEQKIDLLNAQLVQLNNYINLIFVIIIIEFAWKHIKSWSFKVQ